MLARRRQYAGVVTAAVSAARSPFVKRLAEEAKDYVRKRARTSYKSSSSGRSLASNTNRSSKMALRRRVYNKRRAAKPYSRPKIVKRVSRKFSKRVNAVMNQDEPIGAYKFRNAMLEWGPLRNFQKTTLNKTAGEDFNCFSWSKVMDAAGILFRSKTATATSGNAGSIQPSGFEFDKDSKIHVIKSMAVFTLKNITLSAVTITCYTCFPRVTGNDTPYQAWQNALGEENIRTFGTYAVISPDMLGDKPTLHPTFNSRWRTHSTTFTLQPGEKKTIVRYGPHDKTYDYTKAKLAAQDASYYSNTPGINQWVMFVHKPDIHAYRSDKAEPVRGIYHDGNATGGGVPNNRAGIAIEHSYDIHIRAPEETAEADRHTITVIGKFLANNVTAVDFIDKRVQNYGADTEATDIN